MPNTLIQKPQKVLSLHKELEKKKPNLSGIFLLQEKIEGWYVEVYYNAQTQTWGSPVSSAGRTIPAFEWTQALFQQLPKPTYNCKLIAEAYLEDTPFPILNGIFNRSIGDYACKDVVFKCHDFVVLEGPEANAKALDRYKTLKELLSVRRQELHIVPVLLAAAYEELLWKKYFEDIINAGGEGIVAKRAHGVYSAGKRNSDLLKLKLECTVDCKAVELEETVGDKGNNSLVLISKRKNGTLIRTVIGNHTDQNLFRSNPNVVIGKVVTIKAMEEYPDGQLRHPCFKCIRTDKHEEDYE